MGVENISYLYTRCGKQADPIHPLPAVSHPHFYTPSIHLPNLYPLYRPAVSPAAAFPLSIDLLAPAPPPSMCELLRWEGNCLMSTRAPCGWKVHQQVHIYLCGVKEALVGLLLAYVDFCKGDLKERGLMLGDIRLL